MKATKRPKATPSRDQYPDPNRPGCYRVPLAERNGQWRHGREAIIDAADLPIVRGQLWRWSTDKHYHSAGRVCHCTSRLMLARAILGITDPKLAIVYRNDDPLDCRRANLVATEKDGVNRRAAKRKTSFGRKPTSRYRGVSWDSGKQRWRATIKVDGRQRTLGRFRHERDAAERYDEAAREHYGTDARLNFARK